MVARLNLFGNPGLATLVKCVNSADKAVSGSSLPAATQELVKLRASQINGCGFCTDMHFKDALQAGESPVRLNLVAAWPEATVFTEALFFSRRRRHTSWTGDWSSDVCSSDLAGDVAGPFLGDQGFEPAKRDPVHGEGETAGRALKRENVDHHHRPVEEEHEKGEERGEKVEDRKSVV